MTPDKQDDFSQHTGSAKNFYMYTQLVTTKSTTTSTTVKCNKLLIQNANIKKTRIILLQYEMKIIKRFSNSIVKFEDPYITSNRRKTIIVWLHCHVPPVIMNLMELLPLERENLNHGLRWTSV